MPDLRELSRISEAEYTKRKRTFPGIRYLFTIMCFFGTSFMISARINMGVAMTALINHTAVYNNTPGTNECPNLKVHPQNLSDPINVIQKTGTYYWPPDMQNLLLDSFYYFFIVMQIPGGRFSEMFGGKLIFVTGLMISLIFTLLIPFAVYNSFHLLLLVRMLTGAAQGVCLPAIFNLMALWFPNTERNLLQNIAIAGINVGTFSTMIVTGCLCNFSGWASSFYLIGLLGLLFCLFWIFLVTDTPKEHPFISTEELEYITSNQTISHDIELPYFPWKRALSSVHLWAIVIAQVGADWGYLTILNHLPRFFFDILHFELDVNSLLSSFPYLLKAMTAVLSGYISDVILRRKLVSVLFARRFFNTLFGVGSAVGLGIVLISGCNVVAHIVFFAVVMAFDGFSFSGYLLNVMDLSPEFAGTILGILNTASTIRGYILSAVTMAIVERKNTMHQWGYVFLIRIVLILFSTAFFLFFSTAKKQMWHLPTEQTSFSFSTVPTHQVASPDSTIRPRGKETVPKT